MWVLIISFPQHAYQNLNRGLKWKWNLQNVMKYIRKREATSIPCTSGPSNPTSLAAAESVCKGFESQLTLEYWRTSSSVYTLAFLKTSPGLSTLGVPEVKHLRLREWTLWQCKFLTSILARVQINKTRPWCGPSLTVNQVKCNLNILTAGRCGFLR